MAAPQIKSPTAPYRGTKPAVAVPDNVAPVNPEDLPDAPTDILSEEQPTMQRVPLTEVVEDAAEEDKPVEQLAVTRCPRCEYDISLPYVNKPTEEDLQRYALALQPGIGVRFTKDYKLAGGLEVTFRTLSTRELQALGWQMELDSKTDIAQTTWLSRIDEYRLVWQICRIAKGSPALVEFPAGHEAASDCTKESTNLPASLQWLKTEIITNETLLRLLLICLYDFNMRVANLETLARDPDFYNGIAASV